MLQHENPKVRALLDFMSRIGFEFEVLGGYPRDVYFGRSPRDMDVCCWNNKTATVLWRNRLLRLMSYLQDNELYMDDFEVDSDYPSDRIYGGIKTTISVDIIFWKEDYKSPDDILSMFDYNINQFMLSTDWVTGNVQALPWEKMNNFGTLTQLRDSELSDLRIHKTKVLAANVGWKVHSGFEDFE